MIQDSFRLLHLGAKESKMLKSFQREIIMLQGGLSNILKIKGGGFTKELGG